MPWYVWVAIGVSSFVGALVGMTVYDFLRNSRFAHRILDAEQRLMMERYKQAPKNANDPDFRLESFRDDDIPN